MLSLLLLLLLFFIYRLKISSSLFFYFFFPGFSVLGAVLIVAGLYSVLWGKYKEYKEKEAEEIPEPVKGCIGNNLTTMVIEDFEANDVEMQKTDANKMAVSAVAISAPAPKV